jgi:hypothetical protein
LKGRALGTKQSGFLFTLNRLAASHANQDALGFNGALQGIGGLFGTVGTRQKHGGDEQNATVSHETTWNKHKANDFLQAKLVA